MNKETENISKIHTKVQSKIMKKRPGKLDSGNQNKMLLKNISGLMKVFLISAVELAGLLLDFTPEGIKR